MGLAAPHTEVYSALLTLVGLDALCPTYFTIWHSYHSPIDMDALHLVSTRHLTSACVQEYKSVDYVGAISKRLISGYNLISPFHHETHAAQRL
ncbi:hypothetical protein KAV47_08940, partial [Candidatus Bathyarchaeota archaeon]|nr:hypothetical protein [Candidatus Bathyarchaeota archaeon]